MMAQGDIEDQMSVTNVDNGEILDSGSDEVDSGLGRVGLFTVGGLIRIGDGNSEHDVIKQCFLTGMGPLAEKTEVVSVHKTSAVAAGATAEAKFLAFKIFAEAVRRRNSGDANVKYGWYGGSKAEILEIVTHGFSVKNFGNEDGSYGVGIHLVPSKLSAACVLSTELDEDGLRHLLLCRIILGKLEAISADSKQSYPSSTQFDSGVDDLKNPRKYIIWSSNMNSHILPSYILSFRPRRARGTCVKLSPPWISFATLISVISKSLERSKMASIYKSYGDFRERRIGRQQLIRKMREVAGDEVLVEIIKRHREKN